MAINSLLLFGSSGSELHERLATAIRDIEVRGGAIKDISYGDSASSLSALVIYEAATHETAEWADRDMARRKEAARLKKLHENGRKELFARFQEVFGKKAHVWAIAIDHLKKKGFESPDINALIEIFTDVSFDIATQAYRYESR